MCIKYKRYIQPNENDSYICPQNNNNNNSKYKYKTHNDKSFQIKYYYFDGLVFMAYNAEWLKIQINYFNFDCLVFIAYDAEWLKIQINYFNFALCFSNTSLPLFFIFLLTNDFFTFLLQKIQITFHFGQSFISNWIRRTFSNLVYKNDMCHLNMWNAHVFLIIWTELK